MYENQLKQYYNPKPYTFKKCVNRPIDNSINLSIIIPIYNSEKFIKQCLDSIINNVTKYTYEVILIDDGATDSSELILKKYVDQYENFKLIKKTNGGAASARNVGLDNAQGTYIAFIDADDYIHKDYIQRLMSIALKDSCDYVRCGFYRTYGENIMPFEGIEIKTDDGLGENITRFEGFLWMSVIRRGILEDIRLPEGYWYEDMIVRPLILKKCKKVVGIKDCLYYYRQHEENISKTVENSVNYKCLSQLYLADYIVQYAKDVGIDIDDNFKLLIFREYGMILYRRTLKINKDIRKKIFLIASCKIEELNIDSKTLVQFADKKIWVAYQKKSFYLYSIVSLYEKWRCDCL